MTSQLCSEVNGGSCKHKVSARNGYVCAAGHSKSSGVAQPTISISKMNQGDRRDLAKSTEDEALQLQLQLLHTGNIGVQKWLAENPSIDEDLQLELFHTGGLWVQYGLAQNPSTKEDLQWELFRTGGSGAQFGLAKNPSMGRELARELAKVGRTPHGYTQNKSLAELIQPENLALLSQYPRAFGQAYLERLLGYPQEGREESKALTLHSYFVHEKSRDIYTKTYKNEVLSRYAGDQEVTLIISGETA